MNRAMSVNPTHWAQAIGLHAHSEMALAAIAPPGVTTMLFTFVEHF